MEIICDKCNRSLKISDEKIPEERNVTVRCPTCKNKITVRKEKQKDDFEADAGGFETDEGGPETDAGGPEATDGKNTQFAFDADYSEDYEQPDRMFEFIEDEGKIALICEMDQSIKEQIKPVLDFMEYHIIETNSSRDAIKKLRYNAFNMIVLNEEFDTSDPDSNGILIYLERMQMQERRKIFVALLSRRFQTLDHMMALHKSVNMIINLENLNEFEKILKHGISDSDMSYRIYMETLKNAGRV